MRRIVGARSARLILPVSRGRVRLLALSSWNVGRNSQEPRANETRIARPRDIRTPLTFFWRRTHGCSNASAARSARSALDTHSRLYGGKNALLLTPYP